jgi:hypothetical protein
MVRRYGSPLYGSKYGVCLCPGKYEVHDLDNETHKYDLDKIIKSDRKRPYVMLDQRDMKNVPGVLAILHNDGHLLMNFTP